MTAKQREEFLDFALLLAGAAEEQIMPRYRNCAASEKPDGSDVTEADLAAEKAMRQMIARRYPHHAVLGEELGVSASPNERYRWILDPLDGTTWFVLGVPICGMVTMLTGERDGAIFGGSLVSSCGESLHREIVALAVPVALHDGPQRLVRPK